MNERNPSLNIPSANNHSNISFPVRQHSVQIAECHTPKSYQSAEESYVHCFLTLKSQRTILERLLKEISDIDTQFPSTSSPSHRPPIIYHEKDQLSIKVFRDFLNNFFNCSYGELLFISVSASSRLKPIIRNQNLSFGVKKIALRMINSVLAINHLLDSIENEYRHRSGIIHSIDDDYSDSDDNNIDCNVITDNDNENSHPKGEICRMCNEYVPIDLFVEHTQSCFKAYHAKEKLQSIQNELTYTLNSIYEDFLCVLWPGEFDEVKNTILPMLRVSLLLERATQIDWKNNEALDELQYIFEVMSFLGVEYLNQPCASIINTAKEQIQLKAQMSTIIKDAAKVLKITRISGNSDTQKIAQVHISDFDFVKRISAGAFARVFLAKNKRSDDIYAVKVLSKDDVVQKNQVKRVVLEKDILLQFNFPYIINFYYSISGTRNLYLVMEYLPGGDLFSLLHNVGCLPEESAKAYTYQIAVALSYLHSRGIIHRDIKPDNVLVAADGSIKLTDFGLSFVGITDRNKKASEIIDNHIRHSISTEEDFLKKNSNMFTKSNSSLHFINNDNDNQNNNGPSQTTLEEKISQTRSIVGTPDYIAPEILENKEHTFCVDWWSLGAVLYELLVGQPPFHADTKEKVYENIKACRYTLPTIRKRCNDDYDEEEEESDEIVISEEAADMIKGLLTLDPTKRLGANSSDDVIKHKWFADIDPKNIVPPFKPDLETAYDTQYFEDRYRNFNKTNDSDIIADIEDSLKLSNQSLNESSNRFRKRALTQNVFNKSSPLVPDDQTTTMPSSGNANYIINSCSYDNLGKYLHYDDVENLGSAQKFDQNSNINNNEDSNLSTDNDNNNNLKLSEFADDSNSGNLQLKSAKGRTCSANLSTYNEDTLVDSLSYLSTLGKRKTFKSTRKSVSHIPIGDFRSDSSPSDFMQVKRRITSNSSNNIPLSNNIITNSNLTSTSSGYTATASSPPKIPITLDNITQTLRRSVSNSSTNSILSAGQSDTNTNLGLHNSNDYSESNDSEIAIFPTVTYNNLEIEFPSVSISQLKDKNMQVAKRHPLSSEKGASESPITSSSFSSIEAKQKELSNFKKRTSPARLSNDDMFLPLKVPDLYERIKSSCSLSNENSYENLSDTPHHAPKHSASHNPTKLENQTSKKDHHSNSRKQGQNTDNNDDKKQKEDI